MKPSQVLDSTRVAIRSIVAAHRAGNARVLGSVVRGEDTVGSDIDILVDPTLETALFGLGAIRHALSKLPGVPVDVLAPNATPEQFRNAVLVEARAV